MKRVSIDFQPDEFGPDKVIVVYDPRTMIWKNAVEISDVKGAVYNPDGIDIRKLIDEFDEKGTMGGLPQSEKINRGDEVTVPCDIVAPNAKEDLISIDVAKKMKAKVVVEGANMAVSTEAQDHLFRNGIWYVPDFIANAGGVIGAYAESIDETSNVAFDMVQRKIKNNTKMVLQIALNERVSTREAGMKLAKERVIKAMRAKGIWKG